MNVLNDFLIETKKHKHRFNLLIPVFVVLAEIFFIYGNYHGRTGLENGWMLLFYNYPIINSLFLPVAIACFASRLTDIEYKGDMLKSLYTFSTPERIFYTKYIYGVISVVLLVSMMCGSFYINCKILNFPTEFPIKYLIIFAVTNFITCLTLFTIHMILAFFYRNQAVNITVGILGSFMGLFTAFLPETIFQKILPWGSFTTSMFVRIDWDRETRVTDWILTDPSFFPTVINILWIVLLTCLTLLMLKRSSVEEKEKQKRRPVNNKISLHKRPIEVLKLKGSPAWVAFIIVPVLSAIIGTINYTGNLSILTDGWYSLWSQHTLFLCYFFMSVMIGLFAGCIWRADHAGTNMNILLTHNKASTIILGKYLATCFITSLSIIWMVVLFIISGLIVHVDGPLPSEMIGWVAVGMIASWAICAFQIFTSLVIRNLIVPIVIAFIGGLAGLVCISKDIPYLTPYSVFDAAMNRGGASIIPSIISSGLFITLFLTLSILYLSRSDAKTQE